MKLSVKTGDNVLVIAGKDKGKTGKVIAVYPSAGRVKVEDVNIVSRHRKPRSAQVPGGIFKEPAAIDASNVQVICPACSKATRVRHGEADGKKVRVCAKCGASLDVAKVEKKSKKADAKAAKPAKTAKTRKKDDAAEAVKTEATEKPVKAAETVKAEKKAPAKKTAKAETETAAKKTAAKKTAKAETETAEKKAPAKKAVKEKKADEPEAEA